MSRGALLVLVAGCGRVAFDSASDAAGMADARACIPTVSFDEDGDGITDDCDVCPHLPDPMQLDGDGDGLGDACEHILDIDSPRQRIRFFDGFNTARSEWDSSGQLVGGQRVFDVASSSAAVNLVIPGSNFAFLIGGTIVAVGPSPQMYITAPIGPSQMYYVELIDEGSGRRRSLMRETSSGYTELDGITNTGVPITPGPFRMRLGVRPDRMEGEIFHATDAVGLNAIGTPPITTTQNQLAINELSIVLDWALWIETF